MMWLIGKMSRKNFKKTRKLFKKEFEAFKAYEKVFIKVFFKDFNKAEEEVAFETLKGAFENIKEPCKKLFDQPMSNVDSLFQAFEEFCRVRESCVKKLGSILNLISEIKKFIIANLVFEVIIVQIHADLCFSDHDKLYYARNDSYSDNADVLYEKVVPMENSYDGKGIQRCAPSKETDDYLREKLDRFPITADLISELIRKIKGIVMDNLHCEYIVGNVDGVLRGTKGYDPGCPVKAYDCTFSDNTDNKLLDVLEEIPDKLVQQEVMEVKVATVMLNEEWKKWAKVHNAFFSCFSI